MGGGYLTPIIAILALLMSGLTALKSTPPGVCVAYRCLLDDYLPVAGIALVVVSLGLLFAVVCSALKIGPQALRNLVDRAMTPPDTKPSADMSLEELVKHAEPRSVRSSSEGLVDADVQERVSHLFVELQKLASTGKLTVFGCFAPRGGSPRDSAPTEIRLDFWGGAKIEYSKYLENADVEIQKDGRSGSYTGLRFDRKQVMKYIPRGH